VGRTGPVILLVIAACGVIAIAATGVGLLIPAAALSSGWVWVVRIAGAALAIGGLRALVVQRRRLRPASHRGPDPTAAAFSTAATIMTVLALLSLLSPATAVDTGSRSPNPAERPGPGSDTTAARTSANSAGANQGFGGGLSRGRPGGRGTPEPRDRPGSDAGGSDRSVLPPLTRALLPLLLIAATVIGILALTGRLGRRGPEPPSAVPVAAADAEASLESSLHEVAYDGPDPRRQITAAYHRLLSALAAAGAPRQPHEAPHEHLNRVLGPLGVRPEPMHRLTELYVVAQFSERPITEEHRMAAAAALEAGLVSLRASNGFSVDDRGRLHPQPARA
jgi:Domain of unknown function (DUF4129)